MMESDLRPHEFDNFGHRAEDKLLPPRVAKLELDVSDLKTRLDQMATKEDLAKLEARVAKMEGRLVKWLVGSLVGFTTMNIVVMTFVLNYAAPPQGRFARLAETQQQPLVIVLPPGAVQWPAQPPK
jgi:tetrahydromethanopterin S-methyltransferase subunit G